LLLQVLDLLLDAADLELLVFGSIAVAGRPGRLDRLLVLLELILQPLQFLLPAFLFLTFLVPALPALSCALARASTGALTSAASVLAAARLTGLSGHVHGQHTGDCDDADNCGGSSHSGLQTALQW